MTAHECVYASATCGGELEFGPDPFAEEIHGDETPMWMCEEHRYISSMEI